MHSDGCILRAAHIELTRSEGQPTFRWRATSEHPDDEHKISVCMEVAGYACRGCSWAGCSGVDIFLKICLYCLRSLCSFESHQVSKKSPLNIVWKHGSNHKFQAICWREHPKYCWEKGEEPYAASTKLCLHDYQALKYWSLISNYTLPWHIKKKEK